MTEDGTPVDLGALLDLVRNLAERVAVLEGVLGGPPPEAQAGVLELDGVGAWFSDYRRRARQREAGGNAQEQEATS